MMDFIAQFAAVAKALKDAAEVARRADLADLERALLDLRDQVADLRDANSTLRDENRDLREKLSLREDFVFDRNLWWKPLADGKREGPYCPKCHGSDKSVRMGYHESHLGEGYSVSRYHRCPVCRHTESV